MHLLKYRDLYARQPFTAKLGVGGEFKFVLRDLNLNKLLETDWEPNIITNNGLIWLGEGSQPWPANSWHSHMHVGSDGTPATFTDTGMGAFLGSSATLAPGGYVYTPGIAPNYEFSQAWGVRFAAGVGTGTIAEVGISGQTADGNCSIRNVLAAPIAKAADQVLDVFYKFTVWPEVTTDVTGQVVIDGDTYDYTLRYMNAGDTLPSAKAEFGLYSSDVAHLAWAGVIGTVTGQPTGSSEWCDTRTPNIDFGSGYNDWRCFFDLDTANFGGGIRSLSSRHSLNRSAGAQGFQVELSNVVGGTTIPKDNTKTFQYEMRMTWARH
jgi:hypothetical protein